MDKLYTAQVSKDSEDAFGEAELLVLVHGDIDLVAYAVRRALADLESSGYDGELEASLNETDGLAGDPNRPVIRNVRADAEIVGLLLKKKITSERKANKPAEDATEVPSAEVTSENAEVPAAEGTRKRGKQADVTDAV